MLDFFTLKPEAFGIDISDLSLKIVKLKKSGRFLDLASFAEMEIKPGIIEKGEIKNEESLAKIIRKAVNEMGREKLKTNYVMASLPEEKAFLQVIKMPPMEEKEVRKAVYFEAENYIPFPIDKVYLDCQIVQPVFNHLDHLDVMIAALPKKIVDSYAFSLKRAGLKPLVLEIESQAISRSLIKGGMSAVPLLLIDLGATRASFMIFSGHSLRFTSSISISAQDIAKKSKVNLKKLAEQMKKYLDYYQTHSVHEHLPSNGRGVEKILLCGGGANSPGLADFLAQELKIQVEIGNPWVNILSDPLKKVPELSSQESLKYTTVLGLALRSFN